MRYGKAIQEKMIKKIAGLAGDKTLPSAIHFFDDNSGGIGRFRFSAHKFGIITTNEQGDCT